MGSAWNAHLEASYLEVELESVSITTVATVQTIHGEAVKPGLDFAFIKWSYFNVFLAYYTRWAV